MADFIITQTDAQLQAILDKIQPLATTGDMATLGFGYGVCITEAGNSAKTVSVPNYILQKNVPVSVQFSHPISTDGATLNINARGAKPIYVAGSALQGGLVKAGCTVTFVYDGSHYNIVAIEGLERPSSQSDLFVDMGLPSGLMWAKRNIDISQPDGFASSEYQYECTFFSWGNTEGHNPTSTSAFDYDWGSANDGPYAQTPGSKLTANAGLSHDAARAILGSPWRDPSTEDFAELFANIDYIDSNGDVIPSSQTNKLTYMGANHIAGIRLKSKINGNIIFFPCSGYGNGQSWYNRGSSGDYWSRSLCSQADGRSLDFGSGGVFPQNNYSRCDGFARRAVQ